MERDFSDEVKERLCSQIDEIKDKEWCVVTDFIGDLVLNGGKLLGIISIKDDMSNVETYQSYVLDMANYKKSDIETIFNAVYGVEAEMCQPIQTIASSLETSAKHMRTLAEGIGTGFSSMPAAQVKALSKELETELKGNHEVLTEYKEKEQKDAMALMAKNSAKQLGSAIVSGAANIIAMPAKGIKGLVTKGPAGFVTELTSSGWDLINDTFSAGEAVSTLALSGLGMGCSLLGLEKAADSAYEEASFYSGQDSLTDYFDKMVQAYPDSPDSKLYKTLSTAAHSLDTLNTGYKTVSAVEGMITDVKDAAGKIGNLFREGGKKAAEGAGKAASAAAKNGKSFTIFGIDVSDIKDLDTSKANANKTYEFYKDIMGKDGTVKTSAGLLRKYKQTYKKTAQWSQMAGNAKTVYEFATGLMDADNPTDLREQLMGTLYTGLETNVSELTGWKAKSNVEKLKKLADKGSDLGKTIYQNQLNSDPNVSTGNKTVDEFLSNMGFSWDDFWDSCKVDHMIFAGS